MQINPTSFPTVFKAFTLFRSDNGAGQGWEVDHFVLPDGGVMGQSWHSIEATLKQLSEGDLFTLVCGSPEQKRAIAERSVDLMLATTVLEMYCPTLESRVR